MGRSKIMSAYWPKRSLCSKQFGQDCIMKIYLHCGTIESDDLILKYMYMQLIYNLYIVDSYFLNFILHKKCTYL